MEETLLGYLIVSQTTSSPMRQSLGWKGTREGRREGGRRGENSRGREGAVAGAGVEGDEGGEERKWSTMNNEYA